MTPAQVRKAARLYLLANTACLDLGGCDTEAEEAVVTRAVEDARQALERLGIHYSQADSLQNCIRLATQQ